MKHATHMTAGQLSFVSWNIDGVARTLATGADLSLPALHEQLGRPDVLALQEVRLRPQDTDLIERMQRALPGYVCNQSLCRDPLNVRFRGGRAYGVATFVREDLRPHWQPSAAWDREGRLLVCELPKLELAVANVYAVNGTDKPYLDPETGARHGDRHAYKQRFQTELQAHFAHARSRGLQLVLLGDWNVSRSALDTYPRLRTEPPHTAARAMLNDVFMPALDVVDVYRELHPEERAYSWFSRQATRRGRLDAARVDYALIARAWLPDVMEAEVLQALALKLGSDHAPISVRLRVRQRD